MLVPSICPGNRFVFVGLCIGIIYLFIYVFVCLFDYYHYSFPPVGYKGNLSLVCCFFFRGLQQMKSSSEALANPIADSLELPAESSISCCVRSYTSAHATGTPRIAGVLLAASSPAHLVRGRPCRECSLEVGSQFVSLITPVCCQNMGHPQPKKR